MESCDHAKAMEKINRANELLMQLRAILLPSPPRDSRAELARDLFDEALRSLTAAVSELRPSSRRPAGLLVGAVDAEDVQRIKGSNKKRNSKAIRAPSNDQKKRKLHLWTNVTSIPHIDGHQWRKYGQKRINSEKFLRNYYRCNNTKDQRCLARKTVQQKADNDDPPKFTVCYIRHHTCKTSDVNSVLATWDMNNTQYTISPRAESKFMRCQEDHKDYTSFTLVKPQSSDEKSNTGTELTELLDSLLVEPAADTDISGDCWEDILAMIDDKFDSWDEDTSRVVDNEGKHVAIWGNEENDIFPSFLTDKVDNFGEIPLNMSQACLEHALALPL